VSASRPPRGPQEPHPPRWIDAWLLRSLPPGEVGRSIVGDLHEEYGARHAGLTRNVWYALAALRLGAGYRASRVLRVAARAAAAARNLRWSRTMRLSWLRQELRDATRAVRRHPTWALAALITFALGIGVTTGVFSVVYGALLRPLPYPDSHELVRVGDAPESAPGAYSSISMANYFDLRGGAQQFETIEAYRHTLYNVTGESGPAREQALTVTPGFFAMLGVRPRLGRDFHEEDAAPGAAPVVLLSHALWRERFGGDASVVGRSVVVDHLARTVIGIMPPDIAWPGEPRLFTPLLMEPTAAPEARRRRALEGAGRLRDGVTVAQGRAELQSIFGGLAATYPEANAQWTVTVGPLDEWMLGNSRRLLLLAGGATLLVLLIACVNVANLGIARALDRRHELAVRTALGAGRSRLARAMVFENLVVAMLGGALGIVVGVWVTRAMLALYANTIPRADTIALNVPVVAFAAVVSALSGVLSSLAPVVQLRRLGLQAGVRQGGRGTTASGQRLRHALVTIQIALAVMLSAGAGLLIRTVWRLQHTDLGVNANGVLVFELGLPPMRYASIDAITGFYADLLSRIDAIPGVVRSAAITRRPLFGGTNGELVAAGADPGQKELIEWREATPGFFDVIGQRGLEGRMFTDADARTGGVALVNASLAARMFPGRSPVGERLASPDDARSWEIIGVVSDINEAGPTRAARPTVYWPYGSQGLGHFAAAWMTIVVRTAGEPMAALPAIRDQLHALDPDLPTAGVTTLEELVARTVGEQRRTATSLLSWLAALALALGAIGIYGLVAFSVTRRRRELGVRVVLGADRAGVAWLVVRQALQLALIGGALGIAASLAGTRVLASLLHDTGRADPLTLALVTAVLAATAVAASALPALRATRVQPLEALRSE
jgi:predicted permease